MVLAFAGFMIVVLGSVMSSGRNPVGFKVVAALFILAGCAMILLGAQS